MDRISLKGAAASIFGIAGITFFIGLQTQGFGLTALNLIAIGLILIGGSFYFFYKWQKQDSMIFKIERDPIIKIATAGKNVPASFYGKIEPDEKTFNKILTSPYSHTPCVFYHQIVEEYVSSGDSSYWKIIDNRSDHVPFKINDGSGNIFVTLRNVDSDLGNYKLIKRKNDEQFIDYANSEVDAKKILYQKDIERETNWLGFEKGPRQRVSEYVLTPGQEVFVYGWVYTDKNVKYVAENEGVPLIVSRKTKEKYIEDFAIGERFFYTNNLILFLGIILLFFTFNYINKNIGGVFLLLGLAFVSLKMIFQVYNRIYTLNNRIKNAKSQIDIELKKRHELIPQLVNIVEGYVKYEKKVINDLNLLKKNLANDGLEFDRRLFMIIENYPKLMANASFKDLANQLSKVENNIAYYRGFCNKTILKYNNMVTVIPFNLIAKMTGFRQQEFLKKF